MVLISDDYSDDVAHARSEKRYFRTKKPNRLVTALHLIKWLKIK